MELPKKNTIEEALIAGGIQHLFVDSNGVFCSGQSDCIMTGIFFHELDRDNATINDL
jgi:hypothetical protein